MIQIGESTYAERDGRAFLEARVTIPPEAVESWKVFSRACGRYHDFSYLTRDYEAHVPERIWFSVSGEQGAFLRRDSGDAFVTALIYYAMATGQDISCQSPVSPELLFGINQMLSPLIANASKVRQIRVDAPRSQENGLGTGYVGTGMSMGIDSLHTLYEYTREEVGAEYRLTHLTYFNVGADRWRLREGRTLEELRPDLAKGEAFRARRENVARQIAEEMKLGFVSLDSNLSDLYEGAFEESHLFRSVSAAMALAGGLSKYYFSSTGFSHTDYQPRLRVDAAHYEQFVLPCLSTRKLVLINGGKPFTRLDKLARISGFPPATKHLITCDQETPCYRCTKDYRTIIALDILGLQREYAAVFDPAKCEKAKPRAYAWLVATHRKNGAAILLWEQARRKHMIPALAYLRGAGVWVKLALIRARQRLAR